MINKDLESLIFDFLSAVETSLQLLEDKFGSRSLHQLWHDKKIAQRGEIFKGVSYQLHGNGCMIEYPEHCVDFDFGPNGRTDGFDAWRLYNYACEFPQKYVKYTNVATVESELNQYIQKDMVKKIDNSTSNLYFFYATQKGQLISHLGFRPLKFRAF